MAVYLRTSLGKFTCTHNPPESPEYSRIIAGSSVQDSTALFTPMEFARSQLTKHGWSEGEGLGKNGEGISKAIKIPLKKDNTGVGYNHSADFTNHWWSTAFDDALKNISIIIEGDRSEDVNPLPVKDSDISALKTKKDEELVLRKVTAASDVQEEKSKKKLLLFGAFQKGSKTLQMEKESLLKTASSPTQCVPSDGTNLREGDMTPSYIERNRHFAALSDDQLLEACGGRTAHKAARRTENGRKAEEIG